MRTMQEGVVNSLTMAQKRFCGAFELYCRDLFSHFARPAMPGTSVATRVSGIVDSKPF